MIRQLRYIAIVVVAIGTVSAQIQTVELYGSGALSIDKRFQVTDATAFGGGVKLQYGLVGDLSIIIDAGYSTYSIEQTNEVQQWGWTIWERRYRNWVNIYTADTANFSSKVVSVQTMDVLPVSLNLAYRIELATDFDIRPVVGVGIDFFTRKLYHEETWTRKYPADGYQFTYSYHNFAPYKYGNPVFLTAGAAARFRISGLIVLHADCAYKMIAETSGELGYDNYPLTSAVTFTIGIGFQY